MRNAFILFLLLMTKAHGLVLTPDFVKDHEHQISEVFRRTEDTVQNLVMDHAFLQEQEKKGLYLDQVDLEFSLSAELGLKLFSVESEKSLELIWVRKTAPGSEKSKVKEIEEEIFLGLDVDKNYELISSHVSTILEDSRATPGVRTKVFERIYKDASRITRLAEALATYPGKDGWRINRIFQNYHFSAQGELLAADVGYDKRLRFRFNLPTFAGKANTRYERRIHKRLSKAIHRFEKLRSLDRPFHSFRLDRVRIVHTAELELDLKFFSLSKGRGIVVEYVHDRQDYFGDNLPQAMPTIFHHATRSLIDLFEQSPMDSEFPLGEIRLKAELSKSFDLFIASFSKSRNAEYHYRRSL